MSTRPTKGEALATLVRLSEDIRSGVLDSASNLSGISHTYIRVVDAVNTLEVGTDARNTHWAVKYLLDKMANLSGIDTTSHGSMADEYSEADKFYHEMTTKED